MPVQQTISPGYRQLADIFETLETSGLKADQDFGANIVTCFTWYLSPQAVAFLEKKHNAAWMFIKYNSQFIIKFEKWDGLDGKGASIQLNV
jgi:hypothetical protein